MQVVSAEKLGFVSGTQASTASLGFVDCTQLQKRADPLRNRRMYLPLRQRRMVFSEYCGLTFFPSGVWGLSVNTTPNCAAVRPNPPASQPIRYRLGQESGIADRRGN